MKLCVISVLLLLMATSCFAAGNVKLYGDLEFADTSVQKTAIAQGPVGLQGAKGDPGPPGPAGQVTLAAICDAITAGQMPLPSFCTPTVFITQMLAGKTIYDAEGPVISAPDPSDYMRVQLNVDGTFQSSGWVSSGVPVVGTVAEGGTWQVVDGALHATSVRGTTIVTMLSNDTVNRFWRVQKPSGITRWYYDQSTAQVQAEAFAASGATP